MVCKNCGAENPENLTFCQQCGARLDGKKVCPSCGAEIDASAKFCGVCGANTEEAVRSVKSETAATSAVATPAKAIDWKKIVTFVSWGCVAFAALMALIFTFCIGASATSGGAGSTITIYDFFGKAYENSEELISGTSANAIDKMAAYIPSVIGTLISAGALISTIVFAIITAIAGVNRFVHKKEANFEKPAIGLYISFALFATGFLALTSCKLGSVGIRFSDATLAGLILGGIGLGGYFGCKIALRIADFKDTKVIVKSSLILGAGVVAIIVAGIAALPVVKLVEDGYGSVSFGYMELIQFMFGASTSNEAAVLFCGLIGFIAQIVAIAFTVLTVLSAAKYLSEGNGGKMLTYAITSTVLSVVNLALAVTVGKLYVSGMTYNDGTSAVIAAPIAVLVLSVAVLAAVIVEKNLFKLKNNEAQN